MKEIIGFLTVFSLLGLFSSISYAQISAFPGAGGGGAQSVGGRGGLVYEVTNLNDSGPGSLRAGVEISSPRTIIFRVGGTININSGYIIKNPFITIAGQTAPGGGIQICGKNTRESMFIINTHDIIIRYLRLRHGYNAAANQTGDPVSVMKGYNLIVDHCTLMWTTDENSDAWGSRLSDAPHNITWSWNIFAEPLRAHPTTMITGSNKPEVTEVMTDIDIHHSLLANSSHRNPLIKNKTFRFVNNIVYNWRFYATQSGGGSNVDIIGNLYKPGPLNSEGRAHTYEIEVFPLSVCCINEIPPGKPSIYAAGNIGPTNIDPGMDNWGMVREVSDENGKLIGPLSTIYRRTEPLQTLQFPITVDPAKNLESLILMTVGASQRINCQGNWIFNRDNVDTRIINEFKTLGGILPTKEDEVGGFPVISDGTPCIDADQDGMPDEWELAHTLNPKNASDGANISSNGYSNLENYLNGIHLK